MIGQSLRPEKKALKFGKQIQKRQLDLPEYAASFLNYKALKKLIKQLSATPVLPAQNVTQHIEPVDPKAALRANKEVFFFRLEREIEKVNVFYLQKEAEFAIRLRTLVDKKRMIQGRSGSSSKTSSTFVTLVEGFQQFDNDLNKLQQFVEVNETAISKILKKWDKTSKVSKTKELYLQRAVELQPCFNRDVLRDLSDRATTARLDLEAWAEGENIQYDISRPTERHPTHPEENDIDLQISQAAVSGNLSGLREWVARFHSAPDASTKFTRAFLSSVSEAPDEALRILLETGVVNMLAEDDINERNCLHKAAISGRDEVLQTALQSGVDPSRSDVYGRIPLHYACLKGRVAMAQALIAAAPSTIDQLDHDNFTPLIHSITRHQNACAHLLLDQNARIDPVSESDHIPLNLACQHGAAEIAALLLQRGARLLPDAEGLYPQHLVARSEQPSQLLLVLRDYGADLDQKDKLYQWTPLFHAASEGRVEGVRCLLDQGVDIDVLDEKGLSTMYYATWEGQLECMKLLWERSLQVRQAKQLKRTQLEPQEPPQPNFLMDTTPLERPAEVDGIPDLSLPPPIIPLRRLRAIGQISFSFQVIKPYSGVPLEITHFATYWKATSADDAGHTALVTGSSLTGDYVQLFVQLTRDGVPVLYPRYKIDSPNFKMPICQLTYEEFTELGSRITGTTAEDKFRVIATQTSSSLELLHQNLTSSFLSLRDVLANLSTSIHINLTVVYPTPAEEVALGLRSTPDINTYADAILTDVFEHARFAKRQDPDFMRSIVFQSYNPNICTALNWKQPNYPVLLGNDLGEARDPLGPGPAVQSSGHTSMSIKDAARLAQSNNFMGLICRSSILEMIPALTETIKELGLVLVADTSDKLVAASPSKDAGWSKIQDGINGIMKANGVLRFNDTIDIDDQNVGHGRRVTTSKMALRRQRQLLFRIFYSTTFTFFFLVLVVLVLVSPADAIWQSYKNTRYLNIFIISGVYVLTAVVAMSILASRIYTNHSVLSSIPKTYIPIEHEDVRKHVRQMVQKVLERNAVVAYNVRPKYLALEVEGDAPGLTSRLSSVSAASPNPERLRACREWAKISHPGWSSPYSPDIPNLQYDVVVEELSSLIEAKAVSLSPADPLHAKSPRLSSPDPFGGHSTDNETAPPDPRIVQFLERPDNMSLRDYVSHLSSLNLINPPALSEQFLELYEYARFSGDPLTEDEFRRLMSIFAEILRGMTHLDEDLTSQIRELAPFEDSPDVYEGYETPTPASLHSSNVDDNHSTLSQTTGSSAQTTRSTNVAEKSELLRPINVNDKASNDSKAGVRKLIKANEVEHFYGFPEFSKVRGKCYTASKSQ
ncbi:putative ankyrin repeat protein nuc-2 [Phaeomoniella chlamydospora]|uniref:Defect at low temperature protein 1 n=1 Tax=Phaeomoniella chlamydospora TaxID=158046 RepID=A0A0G2EER0_PHACM|nr:putative ankyrin repeat protein nuc-2 [Phaeomoniella chlamydospora]